MGKKKLLWLILIPLVILIIGYSFWGGATKEDYIQQIQNKRTEQKAFMATSDLSPFTKVEKENFKGLSYYSPDPAYKVNALIEKLNQKETLVLATSKGEEDIYEKYGYATFTLGGTDQRLLLLRQTAGEGEDQLLLLFSDETSGRETYGAGRYLDLDIPARKSLVIDFNLAYNPYCAYNGDYSCPLPPRENNLPIAVYAGEKVYKDK